MPNTDQSAPERRLIVMRDIPEMKDAEAAMLLHRDLHGAPDARAIATIEFLASKLFGVTASDVRDLVNPKRLLPYYYNLDDDEFEDDDEADESEELEAEEAEDEAEPELVTLYTAGTDDESIVTLLLAFGLDFRDEHGAPLRSTRHMAAQAELAGRGIRGHLPDLTALAAEQWGQQMTADAKRFKRQPEPPEPQSIIEAPKKHKRGLRVVEFSRPTPTQRQKVRR